VGKEEPRTYKTGPRYTTSIPMMKQDTTDEP
jgi:hypothetical protein